MNNIYIHLATTLVFEAIEYKERIRATNTQIKTPRIYL